MIVFYSAEGKFIASVKDGEGGMYVEGDTDFLMQICQGQARYSYFEAHLSRVNNEKYCSFEIPDDSEPPVTESEARMLATKFVMPLERLKFEFSEYPGFGSIGPIVMDKAPEVAFAYLSHQAEVNGYKGFASEWALLERYYALLKATPGAWETYLDEWFDDLPMGDHVAINISENYSSSGKPNHSLLVKLGHELWVSFDNFEDYRDLPGFMVTYISCDSYPDEAAHQVAFWIVEHGGAISAALSDDPEFDYTGSEDEDVNELFEDYYSDNFCMIDCATVKSDVILEHLRKLSPEFVMTELLLDPDQFGTDEHDDALSVMEERIDEMRTKRWNR